MAPSRAPRPAGYAPEILVIDDDDMVRRSVVRVLRRKYTVVDLPDAESALAMIERGARYDAILCDLHLGAMSGRELLLALHRVAPAQANRLVILSGSPRSAIAGAFLDAVATRFLEKPATVAEIDAMVAGLVGTAAQAA
jgi:CheY-like chemotaxis protein